MKPKCIGVEVVSRMQHKCCESNIDVIEEVIVLERWFLCFGRYVDIEEVLVLKSTPGGAKDEHLERSYS